MEPSDAVAEPGKGRGRIKAAQWRNQARDVGGARRHDGETRRGMWAETRGAVAEPGKGRGRIKAA